MTAAIPKRRLDVIVQLGRGSFGEGGQDQAELTGLRVSANIVKGADPTFDSGQLRIWGLTPSLMNALSTLGKPFLTNRVNTVILLAGDDRAGVSKVYEGTIQEAFQDASGPEMALNITTNVGLVSATKPIPPVSYPTSVAAATVAANIAAQMTPAVAFENNGVTTVLPPSYFPGTALDQLRRLKAAANIEASIDSGVLAIWPKGGVRGGLIPKIGPDTGLVGYPRFSGSGLVSLTTLFQPGLRLGGQFDLATSIGPAAGRYASNALSYDIESEMPGGKWFANLTAYRPEVTQ